MEIITRMAPVIVMYLPEYSLPNNNPKPHPPIIPIKRANLFIIKHLIDFL